MKNTTINICNVNIHPGESANLAMPLPEQYSCAPMYMPIKVLHGQNKGPCILVFSTIKGNELNGLEITNRLVDMLDTKTLSGTVIAIPVLNVYGLMHFPKNLPSGRKIDDCFPGKENGNFGERIAYLFTEEILKKADYCIELQTGALNHNILPQVYCNFDNERSKYLAKTFQAPVVTNVSIAGNKLRQTTENLNIPLLVYQAGEAMRFDEHSIQLGVDGVFNVMRAIDILPKQPFNEITPVFSQDDEWIVAHKGGVLHTDVYLGQNIKEGEKIGKISDPFSADVTESVLSDRDGIVVGINTTPLIHEGLQIFKVASFIDNIRAETAIEYWDEQQSE